MENHKRRFVICFAEDRISYLSQELIDSVLEHLPVQDVVRTSILSKKWRYTWTRMRALVFDEQFFKRFGKNGAFGHNGFVRIINHVIFFHKGPILKFLLHIPNMFHSSFQEVNQWMFFLSMNGVHELNLVNSNQRYQLPSYLFSCLDLRVLTLHNFDFKPPHELQVFLSLTNLILKNIDFGANLYGTVINLPQLVKLTLDTCINVYNFKIKATKLLGLFVITCPDAMLLPLLQTVGVMAFREPSEGFARVENLNLARMSTHLPDLLYFTLDGYYFKFFIAEKTPKWLPQVFIWLKDLRLMNINFGDLDQLHGALCLLRNSPNLKKIIVWCMQKEPPFDVEPASNYLDAPDSLDQTFNKLQTVEIMSMEGSRPEVLFIKLLLAHSPSLEKMTIQPSRTADARKRLNIAKDVMRFSRASTKAEMFYLDMNQ